MQKKEFLNIEGDVLCMNAIECVVVNMVEGTLTFALSDERMNIKSTPTIAPGS